jgi:hypothetical protein
MGYSGDKSKGPKVCYLCDLVITRMERWTTVKDKIGTYHPVHLKCYRKQKAEEAAEAPLDTRARDKWSGQF